MTIASRTGKSDRHDEPPAGPPPRRRMPQHAPGRPDDDEDVKLPGRAHRRREEPDEGTPEEAE